MSGDNRYNSAVWKTDRRQMLGLKSTGGFLYCGSPSPTLKALDKLLCWALRDIQITKKKIQHS